MSVDSDSFRELMQQQRVRAREARKALGDLGWAGVEFGKSVPDTLFVGYDSLQCEAKVLALVSDGGLCDEISEGADAIVVLDRTVMYAEMGGQVADRGVIEGMGSFKVNDVQKNKGGKYMHYGVLETGTLKVGDAVRVSVCPERRAAISRAHSATHLLHSALRKVLGDHVHQAGSLVEPDVLRFDFTHYTSITQEELRAAEDAVNASVLAGLCVSTEEMSVDEAKKSGATALFGEKYGDVVRVVRMGPSLEFCGGTHLDNTAKVGLFRISSEGSVASGVRRIEAITGPAVLEEIDRFQKTLIQAAETLKTTPGELIRKAEATVNEVKELRQQMEAMKDKLLSGELQQLTITAQQVKGLHVLTDVRSGMSVPDLRKLGDLLRDKDPNVVAMLASETDGKISVLAVCGPNAVKQGVKAGVLVKTILSACGGSGGGKPDSAMGGCKDMEALKRELAKLPELI
jgi:alanyl-tRNA synthetase